MNRCYAYPLLICIAIALLSIHTASLPQENYQGPTDQPMKPVGKAIQDIYTRYSSYLDTQWSGDGWKYQVPSPPYKELDKNSHNSVRMQSTFSTYYKYRNDPETEQKIKIAMRNAFIDTPSPQVLAVPIHEVVTSTRSFNDLIGFSLGLTILRERGSLFSHQEKEAILSRIKLIYPYALTAPDYENRALLGAAYGLSILHDPLLNFSAEEKTRYSKDIRDKIRIGLQAIGDDFLYFEGEKHTFSPHYHLVSAVCLYYAGISLHDTDYQKIAQKMFQKIHTLYPVGGLSSNKSYRPNGIGLQTVLLRAFGEYSIGNTHWLDYWTEESRKRGFIDPKYPNRLVWEDPYNNLFNDDYSFSNIWELLSPLLTESGMSSQYQLPK